MSDVIERTALGGANKWTLGGHSVQYKYQGTSGKTRKIMYECGLMWVMAKVFKHDQHIPDLRRVIEDMDGLIISHAHDDHYGALIHYAKMGYKIPPVYSHPFTLAVIRDELKKTGVPKAAWPDFHPVYPNQTIDLDGLKITFFPINHSIPGGYATGMQRGKTKIVETGDLKWDPDQIYWQGPDINAMKQFAGKEGISALFYDSTKSADLGKIPKDKDNRKAIEDFFSAQTSRRVFVSVFHRYSEMIFNLCLRAAQEGRPIVVAEERLKNTFRLLKEGGVCMEDKIAQVLGQPFSFYDIDDEAGRAAARRHDAVILCDDFQYKDDTTFDLLVAGRHPDLAIKKGDVVLSTSLPWRGKAAKIKTVLAGFHQKGAITYRGQDVGIRCRGHGPWADMKMFCDLFKPSEAIPYYGHMAGMTQSVENGKQDGIKGRVVSNGDGLIIDGKTIDHNKGVVPESWLGVDLKDGGKDVYHETDHDKPFQKPQRKPNDRPDKPKPP